MNVGSCESPTCNIWHWARLGLRLAQNQPLCEEEKRGDTRFDRHKADRGRLGPDWPRRCDGTHPGSAPGASPPGPQHGGADSLGDRTSSLPLGRLPSSLRPPTSTEPTQEEQCWWRVRGPHRGTETTPKTARLGGCEIAGSRRNVTFLP
jgi:hypothetical protein